MNTEYVRVNEMVKYRARLAGQHGIFRDLSLWREKRLTIALILISQVVSWLSVIDMLVYTRHFMSQKGLLKLVVNCCIAFFVAFGLSYNVIFFAWRHSYRRVIEDLRTLHHTKHDFLRKINARHFDEAYRKSKLFQELYSGVISIGLFSYIAAGCLLEYLIDHNVFPLPSFHQINFIPITGCGSYFINFCQQVIFAFTTALNCQGFTALFFHLSLLLYAKIDSTVEVIESMEAISSELSYSEWLKIVSESMIKIKGILMFFRKVNTFGFYQMELLSLGLMFNIWVIFNVDPTKMGFSCTGICVLVVLFVFVWLNEKLGEKFRKIDQAIYNLPWYQMLPKRRKLLVLLMQSGQNPISLSSGGISDLTFEWLRELLGRGYKAAVLFQRLIER